MPPALQNCLLNKILTDWRELSEEFKPEALWLCQFTPLSVRDNYGGYRFPSLPEYVWFADQNGMYSRSVEEWEQFETAENERFDKLLASGEEYSHTFPTGQAYFAATPQHGTFCLHQFYGPRHGRG